MSSKEQEKKSKNPTHLILEEDDEFCDFEEANWQASSENKEITQQWQDDWDVDDADDDFCNQLRAELAKNTKK